MVLSLVFPENSRPPIHRRREFSVLRPFWWCYSHRGKFSSTTLFWTQSRLRVSWWDTGTIFYLTCIGHSRLKHISICCVLGCFNTHFSPMAFRPLRPKTSNRLWALRVSRRKLWVVRSPQFPIVLHCATCKCAYAYMWVIRTKKSHQPWDM